MSLSSKENNYSSKTHLKLEIFQSKVCQNSKVPLPYGLSFIFNDFPEKCIEPIKNENELLKSPDNQFIYYLNNLNLTDNKELEKELIINSYTTSIFIIKKNFASVKIPIVFPKKNNQKQWFFLKDINENICIKILINIEMHSANIINDNHLKNNNILKINSETIKENKINNINKSNTNYINALNHSKINKDMNNNKTYILNTNYNSNSGNSLNITNNIYMRTINNNNNIINNLNITFPFNFSPIPIFSKSNSFYIDTMKEKEKLINKKSIKKNSLNSLEENEDKTIKIEEQDINELKVISENDNDSIIVNDMDNEICSEKNSNNDKNNNKDELLNNINDLILKKNDEMAYNQQICSFNYNNYLNAKKSMTKDAQFIEKENEKIKLNIKNIEKYKQIYETKTINLNEHLINFNNNMYRNKILNELYEYEKEMIQNYNNIFFVINSNENMYNKAKINIDDFNLIRKKPNQFTNKIYSFEINNNKSINTKVNKTTNDAIHIKKLNLQKGIKDKCNKGIDSSRGCEAFKKYSPINYKLKEFNTKLSLSISNSDNAIDENCNNKDVEINNKTIKGYSNKNSNIIYNKLKQYDNNKKYNNIFRDYYYDSLGTNEYKKKSLKNNLIKGNLKIKIPFNDNINNTTENKYSLTKNDFNKENLILKTNSINNSNSINNISNKSMHLNNSNKAKNNNNINNNNDKKKVKSDKYLFKSKYINNTYKKSNTFICKTFIENISLNKMINSDKGNNLNKKKLSKNNTNGESKKKSFNNDNIKNLNNYNNNYFKGKPVLISSNNNSLGNEHCIRRLNINDLSKKTIDSCSEINTLNKDKNKIIRKKVKNNTVKHNININLNINEHFKKKNNKIRKSLNLQGDIILLNTNKQKKSCEKNKKKNKLTHMYSKPVGVNININDNGSCKEEKKIKYSLHEKNTVKINDKDTIKIK